MAEKTSQTSSASNMPNVPAVAPTSDTPYIQPLIGKLGFDTEHPDIFGIGSSPDNGVSFHVWASFKGLVLDKDDMDAIWINGVSDRVKSEVNSATAEIPAIKSAADEAVKRVDSAIADFTNKLSANSSDYVELNSAVASNQVILDSTSKSLEDLATDLTKYAQDAASQGKTIAKLQHDQENVSATVADVKGDVAQLKVDTAGVSAQAANNKNDIASLRLSASSASVSLQNAKRDIAVTSATASQAYIGLQDAKSNIASIQATANGLQGTIANAQSDVNQVKADAQGLHEQITNANSQIATINTNVNGLQSTFKDKVDSSTFTQLAKVVQSKVSSDDFNSKYTQLSNMIDARVLKDDLIGEINLQAGSTLIRNKKIFLDGETVIFGDKTKAFIPSAAIENLEADKITTGTLNGIEIRQLETGGRSIDIKNGNIAIASNDPYEPRISFTNNGKDAKMFNAVGDIEVLNQEFALFNFTPEDTHSLNPIPFFKVTNTGQIGSGGAQLNMDHAIFDGYEWWTPSAGVTFGRTWNGVDKSSDYADIYAKSFVPHSELSAKTRIKKLDRKEALDKIMQDDMYTYQFKEDVRDGVSKRYASFIIDNIHDVAQYTEPEEFLSANGKGRDDGTQLAYLIAAVQYQQEQIEKLKKKLEEK